MDGEITAEEIAKHYSAALDSVNLINDHVAIETLDTEQSDRVARNVEHLELMVAKDFWTTEDLAPLNAAIAAGKTI
jgi:hypothetical protein|tara:strand:+ start:1553 stop:1780 length:228 start_codon:yes stop_codon:yes gene_type:complete